jgi:HSP90 family molecular chaperone
LLIFQAQNQDKWDYVKANFPQGQLLTSEEEARLATKKGEKKKVKKLVQKEKDAEKKSVETVKMNEEKEKQRFLTLSDREKRALAAEKRLLDQKQNIPNAGQRCFQCGVDITGKVPFEYLENRFCKPACVKEHRKKATVKK